jgi:hypothetical protein
MSIKIKPPYNSDDMNIAVYKKDLGDGSAAKSNHTGIVLQKGMTPKMEEAAIAHETVHQMQQRNGDLDYDSENFYWKGKTYSRENLNEHNENLPWEKEAYKESNKILKGKQTKQKMKEKFQLRNGAGNGAAFKNLTDKNLMGPSADMCMPDGTGGSDCPKPYSTTKKQKFKDKKGKNKKTRGVVETKTYKTKVTDPGMEVSVGQFDSQGRSTGRRDSDGKSVSDFKKEVKRTNIYNTDIGERASKSISRPTERVTDKQTIKTRKTSKGKVKSSVKRDFMENEKTGRLSTTPYAMTTSKDRLIGRDKVRKYTTEPSRAQDNKAKFKAGEIGGKNKRSVVDVKLVSDKKMRKLSQKAQNRTVKGKPAFKTIKNKPKKSKSSSSMMF